MTNSELYRNAKQDYPNAVVLLAIGDFYETYNEDADILNKVIGLEVIKRTQNRVAGFPKRYFNEYVQILKKAGFSHLFIDPKTVNQQKNQERNMETKKGIKLSAFKCICPNVNQSASYYWFNQESATLEEVNISQIICNVITGSITYKLAHRDFLRTVVAKADYESDFNLKLYKEKEAYINGQNVNVNHELSVWKLMYVMKHSFKHLKNADNTISFVGYAIKDGQPIEINASDHISEIVLSCESKTNNVEYSINFTNKELDLNRIYNCKKDLFKFESVRVVNNDGTQCFTDAPMKILELTEDQKKAVSNFIAARKALKDAGVALAFDSNDWDFSVFNMNGIKRIVTNEPDRSFEEYLDEGVLRIDNLPGKMQIEFDFDGSYNNDCCSMMCELK